jgi:hypothetical protein
MATQAAESLPRGTEDLVPRVETTCAVGTCYGRARCGPAGAMGSADAAASPLGHPRSSLPHKAPRPRGRSAKHGISTRPQWTLETARPPRRTPTVPIAPGTDAAARCPGRPHHGVLPMTYRSLLAAVTAIFACALVASCGGEDKVVSSIEPTAPSAALVAKDSITASSTAGGTTVSSVCTAYSAELARARAQVVSNPNDTEAVEKVATLQELVDDICG